MGKTYLSSNLCWQSSEGSICVGKVSRDILCTRLPRKMLHKMFLAVLAFFLVAVVLQGCGCDEDEVKKCATPTTPSGACKAYSQCLKDASCCDFEQNGAKMKDAVAAACTTWKLGGDSSENLCA